MTYRVYGAYLAKANGPLSRGHRQQDAIEDTHETLDFEPPGLMLNAYHVIESLGRPEELGRVVSKSICVLG
jgi:hypothetical protein